MTMSIPRKNNRKEKENQTFFLNRFYLFLYFHLIIYFLVYFFIYLFICHLFPSPYRITSLPEGSVLEGLSPRQESAEVL